MKPLLALGLIFLGSADLVQASVNTAWQARDELGRDTWAEVVEIKNRNHRGLFPARVFATIFEFDGVLWFYNESNGTQSLSLYRGQLESDKADLLPLLQKIDSGFSRFTVLPESSRPIEVAPSKLPNGCFIESISALRLISEQEVVRRASLLSYYVRGLGRMMGHTILVYETAAVCLRWTRRR